MDFCMQFYVCMCLTNENENSLNLQVYVHFPDDSGDH